MITRVKKDFNEGITDQIFSNSILKKKSIKKSLTQIETLVNTIVTGLPFR